LHPPRFDLDLWPSPYHLRAVVMTHSHAEDEAKKSLCLKDRVKANRQTGGQLPIALTFVTDVVHWLVNIIRPSAIQH